MSSEIEPSYVVITPAYNEEKFIHYPLETMVRQTVKPLKWVIVDDGSQDRTAQMIKKMASQHDWIEYHYHEKEPGQTYYSSNVYAILKGIQLIKTTPYAAIRLHKQISRPFTVEVMLHPALDKDDRLIDFFLPGALQKSIERLLFETAISPLELTSYKQVHNRLH